MKNTDIADICAQVRRGGKLSIGRNHVGRLRLKLQTGPFGIFVSRYDITEEQLRLLKQNLGMAVAKRLAPQMALDGPRTSTPVTG